MRKSETYVSIDIGSYSIKGLVVSKTPEGYELAVHSTTHSRGIDDWEIKDVIAFRESFNQMLSQIDEVVNLNRASVIISTSCGRFSLHEVSKEMNISESEKRTIDENVIDSLRQSIIENFGDSYQVLHIYPKRYMIDRSKAVFNPLGMLANHLQMDVTTVTIDKSTNALYEFLQDLIPVDFDFASSLITASEGVLTDNEKEDGVCVVKLGHSSSAIVIFGMGVPIRFETVSLGMKNVIKDISIVFNTSLEEAERLLKTHGNAMYGDMAFDQQEVEFRGLDGRTIRSISKNDLAKVIHARLREILTKVKRVYKETIMTIPEFSTKGLPGGVVLLGGGAKVPRLLDLALDVFKNPVRIGTYNTSTNVVINNSEEILDDPSYVSAFGGFISLIQEEKNLELPVAKYQKKEVAQGFFKRLVEIFKNLW